MSHPMTDPTGTNPRGREYLDRPETTASSSTGAATDRPTTGRSAPTGPTPSGATRAEGGRGRGPWWLLALLGLILLGLLIWGLTQWGSGAGPSNVDRPAAPQPAPAAPPAPNAQPNPQPNPADPAATGALTAASGAALFPLATVADQNGALTSLVGQQVNGRGLQVLSVPADEGFWAGNNNTDRVWVELVPAQQESPIAIRQGELIDLSGQMAAHGPDFAAQNGVDAAEGADQLTRQAAHVDAPQDQVRAVGTR